MSPNFLLARVTTHAIAIAVLSICPSVYPFVTLVIHAYTVQDVEIGFAPYNTLYLTAATDDPVCC